MYYEVHGSGGTPLLLLHGGLFNIDLQFGELIPGLAATRQVIATPTFRATAGRTTSTGRSGARTWPLTSSDRFGTWASPGPTSSASAWVGRTALHPAIKNPELVGKLIVSSASFHPDGDRKENSEAVGSLTVEMIAGTPMEQDYRAKSPHPEKLQQLLDKLGTFDEGFTGWSDADISGIASRTELVLDVVLRFLDAPAPETVQA